MKCILRQSVKYFMHTVAKCLIYNNFKAVLKSKKYFILSWQYNHHKTYAYKCTKLY